jgi:hypothetical protein
MLQSQIQHKTQSTNSRACQPRWQPSAQFECALPMGIRLHINTSMSRTYLQSYKINVTQSLSTHSVGKLLAKKTFLYPSVLAVLCACDSRAIQNGRACKKKNILVAISDDHSLYLRFSYKTRTVCIKHRHTERIDGALHFRIEIAQKERQRWTETKIL